MGRENIFLGRTGEALSIAHLERNGYRILHVNFRTPFGELDAVAKKGGILIFIEIKTRASSSLGPPYLAVTAIKKRHLIKNALYYLKRFELLDSDWRIDVVSVKMDREYKVEQMEVIENAVEEY